MVPLLAIIPAMSTLASIGAAATAISGVVGAVGAIVSGRNQAAVAEHNASVQEVAATNREVVAGLNAERQRRANRQQIAAQRAGAAEAGALSGTSLDLLDENSVALELDALTIEYQGKIDADVNRQQAQMQRADAKNYRTAGALSAAGKAIGALGSAFNSFDALNSAAPAAGSGISLSGLKASPSMSFLPG